MALTSNFNAILGGHMIKFTFYPHQHHYTIYNYM